MHHKTTLIFIPTLIFFSLHTMYYLIQVRRSAAGGCVEGHLHTAHRPPRPLHFSFASSPSSLLGSNTQNIESIKKCLRISSASCFHSYTYRSPYNCMYYIPS